jgi:hypothetical protein
MPPMACRTAPESQQVPGCAVVALGRRMRPPVSTTADATRSLIASDPLALLDRPPWTIARGCDRDLNH